MIVVFSAIEGYLDMMPHAGSSSVSPDQATRSLASRLEVVRSYVQKDGESGDENSDESSAASLGGSDEHLPKERAYSVGCKPTMMSGHLRLRAAGGTGRPPKAPGKTLEKSTEVSKHRLHDSSAARPRKISVPDYFQKQSTASEGAAGKTSSDPDADKTNRKTVEGMIRPRRSTLPWDLLRGGWNGCDDPLRPRSSSGGNAASIRDAVRSRLAGRHSASSTHPLSYDSIHHLTQHRELVCPTEAGQEAGEYVEMHCPTAL